MSASRNASPTRKPRNLKAELQRELNEARAGEFVALCKRFGVPEPDREWRFDADRRWRFDFAWTAGRQPIAVEVEGGIWTQGRHSRGRGMLGDMQKYNEAALQGWTVLRCTPDTLCTITTLRMVAQALGIPFREP